MRVAGPFIHRYQMKNVFILAVLGFLVINSAIAVVYSKHRIRMLHIKSQNMHKELAMLNTEWSKLLLEKSTWLADARVEQIAKNVLGMQSPEQINIIGQ